MARMLVVLGVVGLLSANSFLRAQPPDAAEVKGLLETFRKERAELVNAGVDKKASAELLTRADTAAKDAESALAAEPARS